MQWRQLASPWQEFFWDALLFFYVPLITSTHSLWCWCSILIGLILLLQEHQSAVNKFVCSALVSSCYQLCVAFSSIYFISPPPEYMYQEIWSLKSFISEFKVNAAVAVFFHSTGKLGCFSIAKYLGSATISLPTWDSLIFWELYSLLLIITVGLLVEFFLRLSM